MVGAGANGFFVKALRPLTRVTRSSNNSSSGVIAETQIAFRYRQYHLIRTTVNFLVVTVLIFSQNFSSISPYVVLDFCGFSDAGSPLLTRFSKCEIFPSVFSAVTINHTPKVPHPYFHWYFYHISLYALGRLKWILDIIWPLNQRFKLKNQRNWLKEVWTWKFWNVINCILLHWRKKLTL